MMSSGVSKYSDDLLKSLYEKGEDYFIAFCENEVIEEQAEFMKNGLAQGVPQQLLDVSFEQIEKDLRFGYCVETPQATFYKEYDLSKIDDKDDEWRADELAKHPEYGANGEHALKVKLAEFADEDKPEPQNAILLTSKTNMADLTDVTGYLEGKRNNVLIAKIEKVSKPTKLAIVAYAFCKRCFYLGSGKTSYKKFNPPIDPDDIKWHITRYEACIDCCRKGCYELVPILVNTLDLTLVHPQHAASIIVKGVTVFNLAKGDVIAVEGKDDEFGKFWCKKLQVLTPELVKSLFGNLSLNNNDDTSAKILTEHKMLNFHTEILEVSPDYNSELELEAKIRDKFFDICEREKSEVLLPKGLTEIWKNGDDEIRKSSKIFQLDDNNELKFDLAHHRPLRNFRDSLTENRPTDNGKLKRVGRSKFKWYPK